MATQTNSRATQRTAPKKPVEPAVVEQHEVNLYSGHIMKIGKNGYMLVMVRSANAVAVEEVATKLFTVDAGRQVDDSALITELKLKVGDEVAFAANCLADTGETLEHDDTPIFKAIAYEAGTLSIVRRKLIKAELKQKDDGALPSAGITTRLTNLMQHFFG